MTKRFSPKAGDYTIRMASVQAQIREHTAALKKLKDEEVSLREYLMPFYEEGESEIETSTGLLTVRLSLSERTYLDQEAARNLILRLNKKVPEFTSELITFKVAEKPARKGRH